MEVGGGIWGANHDGRLWDGSDFMSVLSRLDGLKIIVLLSAIGQAKARVIDHSLAFENQVVSRRDLAVLVALGGKQKPTMGAT